MIINNGKSIEVLKFDLDKYQKYGCLSIPHISLMGFLQIFWFFRS